MEESTRRKLHRQREKLAGDIQVAPLLKAELLHPLFVGILLGWLPAVEVQLLLARLKNPLLAVDRSEAFFMGVISAQSWNDGISIHGFI